MAKRGKIRKPKKPYNEAQDDEKVRRNWTKTLGLFNRGEYSVAVLRAATSLELMANFAIRKQLVDENGLPIGFVDKLLKDANGIAPKYTKILLPIMEEDEEVYRELKTLWDQKITKVNARRNAIAHRGEFEHKGRALELLCLAHKVLSKVMPLFGSDRTFKDPAQ